MHDDGYFREPVAARYDESSAEMFDPAAVEPVVDFLAALAGTGRALELGIGTGRIALPLVGRGVAVAGIDLSEAMVARLRAKPGGGAIEVVIGDFATTTVAGTFSVAFVVYNTLMNLRTQEAQIARLPECRGAPRTRRLLRRGGHDSRAAMAAAGRDDPCLRHERGPLGHR